MKKYILVLLFLIVGISSCKKDSDIIQEVTKPVAPVTIKNAAFHAVVDTNFLELQ